MLPTRQAKKWKARQAAVAGVAGKQAAAAWGQVDPAALDSSWTAGLPQMSVQLRNAQLAAAAGASDYVAETLGAESDPAGLVRPSAFTGVASDGRSLTGLLYQPIIRVKQSIGLGMPTDQAMDQGLRQLLMIVGTQVLDTGRAAVGAAQTADRGVLGYVRYLSEPSCDRCTVLAGRLYRWNSGFLRHPLCKCITRPVTRGDWDEHKTDVADDPRKAFEALTTTAQNQLFTQDGAQAIRDGADLSQVVNARSGMYTAGGNLLTRTGITSRAVAGQRLLAAGQSIRLMPEQIYREARGDRDLAIRLLKANGYLL